MSNKIQRIAERLQLLFSSTDTLRKRWPMAPQLEEIHIKNCKVVTDRWKMVDELPKGGVCAELGIWKCDFSEFIFQTLQPEKLHLIDIDSQSIQIALDKFSGEIDRGEVQVHHSDSSAALLSMPDQYFDWIYIDGDHQYHGVKKDLMAAHEKLSPSGLISLNDYIFFGSSDLTKYGVVEAVNEFCVNFDYEIVFMALHGRMYNDVTLRRIDD